MIVGLLTLHLRFAGCGSLKDKRRRLKPLLARLHREFNISVAEVDFQDVWQEAVIACVLVSNDNRHTQRSLSQIVPWLERHWPDVGLISTRFELR